MFAAQSLSCKHGLNLIDRLMSTPSGLDANTEKKIDELLQKMTLDEKVGQLNQYNGTWDVTGPAPQSGDEKARYEALVKGKVGSMLNVLSVAATREAQQLAVEKTRLGIPLIFGYDVIHGYRTMFPIPLAEAASWDLETVELSARIAAVETAAAGVHWTFAPMIDIGRDARWGRVMEGSGEDTYLGTLMGAARVRGFQGDDLSKPDTIAACAKHFAAYGFAEGGRDYNTVDISDHTLHNVVLPPFKACVEAGVATVMNGFNELGGMPVTGNAYLQRDLLKGKWGFDGFVISDWASIGEMQIHGVAANKKEAAHLAITAGSDMDMESNCYVETLAGLVKSGEVDEALVDDAVRRVLRIKFRLGLFDDPYRYCNEDREKEKVGAAEHVELSRQVAKKSIVLLKNENDLLPLPKTGKTIAVIGPLAADKDVPLGSWRGQAITGSAVSLLEGVQQAVGEGTEILYAEGCKLAVGERSFTQELTINQEDKSGFAEAIEVAKKADAVVLAIGEDAWQSGEGRSQVSIELAGVQEALLKEIHQVNPNMVMILMNGRPLAIQWAAANVPAILEVWHLGSAAGLAIADVLFGDYNPAGKLPISFPHATGQVPIYYNQKNTGRPTNSSNSVFWSHYTDSPKTPLFPFGFGLSYTNFAYGNLALSADTISMNESLHVSVKVTNTGKRAGEEVVQLYIRDLVGSVTRPVKELKGFKKIHLEPGASETVTFELSAKDLAFYTRAGKWQAEPGDFKVFVGTSSVEVQEASFRLV